MADIPRIQDAFTSTHWRFLFESKGECPPTIFAALSEKLPHIDPASWSERLTWGGVFVNGYPKHGDEAICAPCKLEYYEPKFSIAEAKNYFPQFSDSWVVYEDEDLIVAHKPACLPCIPAREQTRFNLRAYLEQHTGSFVHMPSRLDMSTSGLVVASKSTRMHNPLQRLFEHRLIKKRYLLTVRGALHWRSTTLQGAIGKDPAHAVLRKVVPSGGRSATTFFRYLVSEGNDHVLEAQPKTGRTHQIRVHISTLGYPIVGDNFYGGAPAESLHLLSWRIAFENPFTKERLDVRIERRLAPDWALAAIAMLP